MKQGVVTFLDVLGWKGIWQRKQDALDQIKSLTNFVQTHINRLNSYPAGETPTIEVVNISDTIAIIAYNDVQGLPTSTWDINNLIQSQSVIIARLIRLSLLAGLPLRGAMAVGEFEKADNSIVGPVIDEVAAWYELCDWVGVILTPSASLLPPVIRRFAESEFPQWNLYDEAPIVEYDAPTKSGKPFRTRCINWPVEWIAPSCVFSKDNLPAIGGIGIDIEERTSDDLKSLIRAMTPLFPEVYIKYQNTLAFFEKSIGRYKDQTKVSRFRGQHEQSRQFFETGVSARSPKAAEHDSIIGSISDESTYKLWK